MKNEVIVLNNNGELELSQENSDNIVFLCKIDLVRGNWIITRNSSLIHVKYNGKGYCLCFLVVKTAENRVLLKILTKI